MTWTPELLVGEVFLVALGAARVAGLLVFVPLFPRSIGGQLLRAGIIVALSLPPIQAMRAADVGALANPALLVATVAKEAIIGAALGFVARMPLAVIQGFGAVVDNLRGAFSAEQLDRSRSPDESLLSDALTRLVLVIFIQSGALVATLGVTYASYAAWPVDRFVPVDGVVVLPAMIELLGALVDVAVRFALPILIACLVVDVCLAFVGVAAPQAESYFISMPLKAVLSLILLAWVVDTQIAELMGRTMPWMKTVFPWAPAS